MARDIKGSTQTWVDGRWREGRGWRTSSDMSLPDALRHLLPTPRVSAANGAGSHGDGGPDLRTALLPTPSAADGMGGHLTRDGARSDELLLPGVAKALLPTPRSQNGEDRNNLIWARPLDEPQNLENALARLPLLPTPTTMDDRPGRTTHAAGNPTLQGALTGRRPMELERTGDPTAPRSGAGRPCSDDPLPFPPWEADCPPT
jgi:hypothetical protein